MTIVNTPGTRPSQAANTTSRAHLSKRGQIQSASSIQHSTSRPSPGSPPIPLTPFENITLVENALQKFRQQRLEEAQMPIFISPMAKVNLKAFDEDLFPLKEKVREFLASERQVMLILGGSGVGKSTFCRYLELQLWTAYQNGDPIPLFMYLPAIERPDKDLIGVHLRTNNFSEEQIQGMKQHRQFVLICDGYDRQLTFNLHTANLFNRPGQWNVKMVISCRTQHLGQNYRGRFIPGEANHNSSLALDLFQEAVIAPFTKEQIEYYVEQYVPLEPRNWTTKDYMDKLITIPSLMDLVKDPFLLSLLLEVLPGVTEGKQDLSAIKITRVQLYDTFVRHWLDVNSRRLQQSVLIREDRDMLDELLEAGFIPMGVDYATRLALAIFEHHCGNPVVQYVHIKDKKTRKADFFGPDPEARMLRESSPLNRNGSQFQFIHRSMLEYFLSCAVFDPSSHKTGDEFCPQPDPTSAKFLATDRPLFKCNLLTEPSVIQFLCERVKQNPCFEKDLLAVIEQSKTDATAAIAAANAITILVRAGVRFNSADLRGIRIAGADLSNGQFDSAQLQGADLRGVNFARSWLRQVDFGDAHMDGVRFGELPYLEECAAVNAVAFSPHGNLFAVALRGGRLITYDTTTWSRFRQHKEQSEVLNIAFSPNNKHLAFGNRDMTCRLWDTANGDTLLLMEGHTGGVNSVAFSPCGKQIASASDDSTIRLWSSETGECLFILSGHDKIVLSATYSPDGQRLVSCSVDGTIRVWDPETGAPVAEWVIPRVSASCVAHSADGSQFALMAGSMQAEIHLVDAVTGETGLILDDDAGRLTDIAFTPFSKLIVSSGDDKTVRLWDSSNGQLISRLSGHNNRITTCTFSPDGLQIASGDLDGIIRLWELNQSSSLIQQLAAGDRTVAYSNDGLSIISYHDANTIQQWDSSAGDSRSTPLPSASDVHSVTLSPNGHLFASACNDGNIRLCNVQTDVVERVLLRYTDNPIVDMSFSHCGRRLVSCDHVGVTQLWDLNSSEDQGKLVGDRVDLCLPRGYVVFSPVGEQFAVGLPSSPTKIRLFDPRATDLCQPLKELCLSDTLHSMEYSPDGQRLVLGAGASSILLWDLQSDELNVKLEGHKDEVICVACSPCGKWILSGSRDKTARLWLGEVDSWSCVAVISGCSEAMTSAAWNPVVPLEFVTGSDEGSVRVWRISIADAGDVSIHMHWGSPIERLCAADLTFKGVAGLSPIYRKLLVQRGAIDD